MKPSTFTIDPNLQDCQFIDVREPAEFNAEKISGAKLLPLSQFKQLTDHLDKSRPLVLVCRTGSRAKKAADELLKKGYFNVQILEGGLEAWKAAGKPTITGTKNIWGLERQVRFVAGSLVLVGALGTFVHPNFVFLSALVGAGLVFSAVTDTCAMAMALAKMPWNRTTI